MTTLGLPALLGLAAAMAAAAEPATPMRLTLQEAIRLAGERSVSVLVANDRVMRAIERSLEVRASLLPDLTGAASETRQTENPAALGLGSIPRIPPVLGPYDTFDARLTLTQPIFDAAAYQRFMQAKVGAQFSQANLAKARNDAMSLVADLYLQARQADEALENAEAQLRRAQAHDRVARKAADLGTGTEVAAVQAASDLQTAQAQRLAARSDADSRRRDLEAGLGWDEDRPIQYSTETLADLTPPESIETLLEEQPDVAVARTQASEDQIARAIERSQYLPSLSAAGDYGLSGGNDIADSFPTYSYGLKLSLPLFDSGARSARVKQAVGQYEESRLQADDAMRRQRLEAESARENEEQAEEAVASARAALELAQRQFALAQSRAARGMGSDLDVEDAAAASAAALDALSGESGARDMAIVRVAKALGEMDLLTRSR